MRLVGHVRVAFVVTAFALLIQFGNSTVLAQSPTQAKKAVVVAPTRRAPSQGSYFLFLPMLQASTGAPPVPSTPKKGAALTYQDCSSATSVAAVWEYGWAASPPNCASIENVPMIWGANDVNAILGGNSDWIMGFNEPDSQSNISPANAALLWRQIEQKYPSRKLLAPAPSGANPTWVVDFYNAYVATYGAAPRLDALAVHCYAWSASACITHTQRFETWANTWGVPEVWVTEFSISPAAPNSPNQSLQEAQSYINWMESDPMVTHFAWFASKIQGNEWWLPSSFNTPLVDWNSGQLTSFGSMYLPFR